MSQLIKNTIVIIMFAVLAGAGYFLFLKSDNGNSAFTVDSALAGDILQKTQVFIDRRVVLQNLTIDVSLFSDPRFVNLQSYSTAVPAQTVGKTNLFDEAEAISAPVTQ